MAASQVASNVDFASKPSYMLIRFHSDCAAKCRQAIHENLQSIHSRKGRIIGLAVRVEITEGPWPLNTGLAVLYFPTASAAISWLKETPNVCQDNWIHHGLDILLVPLRTPYSKRPLFVFQDVIIKDPAGRNKYFNEYLPGLEKCKLQKPASLSVIATDSSRVLRGKWNSDLLLAHQFDVATDMRKWKDCESYGHLREQIHLLSHTIVAGIALLREIKDR